MAGTLRSTTNCSLRKLRRARVGDFRFFEASNAARWKGVARWKLSIPAVVVWTYIRRVLPHVCRGLRPRGRAVKRRSASGHSLTICFSSLGRLARAVRRDACGPTAPCATWKRSTTLWKLILLNRLRLIALNTQSHSKPTHPTTSPYTATAYPSPSDTWSQSPDPTKLYARSPRAKQSGKH